jgi:hypothetical protein
MPSSEFGTGVPAAATLQPPLIVSVPLSVDGPDGEPTSAPSPPSVNLNVAVASTEFDEPFSLQRPVAVPLRVSKFAPFDFGLPVSLQ